MGRAPLRPALRAYAHAPAAVAVETAAAWVAPTSSIAFDGANDYALTGDMAASIPQGAHSVSWWMKAGTATSWDAYMWAGPKNGFYNLHRLFVASRTTWTQTRSSDGLNNSSRVEGNNHSPPLNNGNWQHWCFTCSGTSSSAGSVTLYVDGQAEVTIGTAPAYLGTADYVMYLARWGTYAGDYAACNIAEVTVWDYELSGAQVGSLWNGGTVTNPQDTSGISTDPVHYWRMGSNMSGSTTVLDEVGSVNLELYNGAATSTDVPGSPASIPGTLLWIDPADDTTITYSSGNVPSTISDKGYLNTAWSITADTLSAQSFSFSGYNYTIDTITGKGNGNNWFRFDPTGTYRSAFSILTPTSSPYNLTSGAGSAAIESDWFLWHVLYLEDTGSTVSKTHAFMRGIGNHTPAKLATVSPGGMGNPIMGDWASSLNWNSISGETIPVGYVSFIGCQSYDDGGTRKYRYTQDGVNWFGAVAHGRTNGTPSASTNVWTFQQGTSTDMGLQGFGDAGFISGTISASDMKALYDYLDAKWGFDLP